MRAHYPVAGERYPPGRLAVAYAPRSSEERGESMGTITGSSTAEIEAPIEQVWEVVEDVLSAPEWQDGLKDVEELERDADGHVTLVESSSDAKVRTIRSTVRFSYDGPERLAWRQEKGELKSVDGAWELEDLGGDRTRAVYRLEVDLGRMLSLVVRGPLVDALRGQLVGARAGELKQRVEAG
jgi:carbon monoxide dehydrogenase subunit G